MRISQREARRLLKQVKELERTNRDRYARWSSAYPGGVHIMTVRLTEVEDMALRTAHALGHAVIARFDENGDTRIYAVPVAK